MFKIIDRYIGRAILTTSLLVLLTLVVLASIFAFIGELENVGQGGYTAATAAQYVFLTMPSKAYLLFSPSVLLGSLLGLGALAGNSELTVMRAAGISNWRIIRAVMLTGFVLMLLIAVIGESLVPRSERAAEELRLGALEERLSVQGGSGFWFKSGDRVVQVKTIMPDYTLLDVVIHRFEGQKLLASTHVARALREGDDWQLEDIQSTSFHHEEGEEVAPDRLASTRQERQLWSEWVVDSEGEAARGSPLVSPELLASFSVSSESLSAENLYQQVIYLDENQLDSRAARLAFWSKLASPLSTLVMLMLSLPFVFGSQRSGGAGQKIFIGIMLGIAYVLVNRLLTQLALANGVSPFLSALIPLLLFTLLALVGIRRTT